jgi:hypothetical protein
MEQLASALSAMQIFSKSHLETGMGRLRFLSFYHSINGIKILIVRIKLL